MVEGPKFCVFSFSRSHFHFESFFLGNMATGRRASPKSRVCASLDHFVRSPGGPKGRHCFTKMTPEDQRENPTAKRSEGKGASHRIFGREVRGPKFRAYILSFLSWGPFVILVVCLPSLVMCTFSLVAPEQRGSHDSRRPQTLSNTPPIFTKSPRENEEMKTVVGEGENKNELLGSPAEGCLAVVDRQEGDWRRGTVGDAFQRGKEGSSLRNHLSSLSWGWGGVSRRRGGGAQKGASLKGGARKMWAPEGLGEGATAIFPITTILILSSSFGGRSVDPKRRKKE